MHVLFEKGDETCMKTTVSSLNYLKIAMDVMGLSDTNLTKRELDEIYTKKNNKIPMIKEAYSFLNEHLPASKEIHYPESNQKTITTVYDKFDINGALKLMEVRLVGELIGMMGDRSLRKRKDSLKEELRSFDLNSVTCLDYFSKWNEYGALKSYFDYNDTNCKNK